MLQREIVFLLLTKLIQEICALTNVGVLDALRAPDMPARCPALAWIPARMFARSAVSRPGPDRAVIPTGLACLGTQNRSARPGGFERAATDSPQPNEGRAVRRVASHRAMLSVDIRAP